MAIVDDYKDIRSRMKGDLKPQPEPQEEHSEKMIDFCKLCIGSGKLLSGFICIKCGGTGFKP